MYIGHAPTNAGSFVLLDDIEGTGTGAFNSSTLTFNLKVGGVSVSPKASSLLIAIDGVVQQSPSAYTVSGSTIVFTGAPASTQEFYGILMGQSASVGAGTVDEATLKISNAGSNGQYLQKQSANTGGLTWATVDTSTLAPLASPDLTGNPTAPTQSASNNSTRIATTAYADTAVSNLVDSAPAALDTLNELAAALGDDASFSTTVTNSIAAKLPLAGGTMTGTLTVGANTDGHDVKFFGDTTGKYMLWDESADKLIVSGIVETTDLILHNERGHYTIVEEEDYLGITNENTGKKYKFVLEAIDE